MEIEFDDEVRALILLASLPNSWEAMRMMMSNFARKSKLKYDDIRDLILSEEVHRRDANIDNAQDQTIGALRFDNNFLAKKTKKLEVELFQVRA